MTEIDFYKKPDYIKSFSKYLKHNQTPAEKILREHLRAKKFYNLKFHRQKPLFVYREKSWIDRFFIADLYCHKYKLIIELDWSIHQKADVKDYDQLREYLLKESWYFIIRYTNDSIEKNLDWVIEDLKEKIKEREAEVR